MAQTKRKAEKTRDLIYVIAGKEESMVNLACEKVLADLIDPQQRLTALFHADPAKTEPSEVFDELRTLPFLADRRVVLVKRADKFVSDNRRLLEGYFDNPCATGILVLTLSSWPANTKLAKKLTTVGKLVSVAQPKPWQFPQRLSQYAHEAHNKILSRSAAELLVELTGDSLPALYSEIDKLALFADTANSITPQHIQLLVGHNRFFNAFAVIDAVTAGNVAMALNRLRTMFAADKSTEFTFIGAFAFHFRRMFNAKVLLEEGANQPHIAQKLRIWQNKEAFFTQLRRLSLRQIGDYLQHLAETDYAIKKGRTKPPVAAEQLVLKMAKNTHFAAGG